MRSARARELLREFFATAVGEHRYAAGSMSVTLGIPIEPEGEELLAIVGRSFVNLDEAQSERTLETLIDWETRHPKSKAPIVVTQAFALSGWRIQERLAPARSMLMIHYGNLPSISTMFTFESRADFEHVQRVMAEIKLCKLDARHLKAGK